MYSTLTSTCSDPSLFRQGAAVAHLDSFPPHNLVLRTDGSVPFPFGKGGSGVLANCFLCGTEATLSFSAGPICSSFSAEACAILHALNWSRLHQQKCHFSSTPIWLSFFPRHPVLSSIFRFISNSVADLAGTVFSFLLFYQAAMGPRTFVSLGQRRGWWAGQTVSATCALRNPFVISLLLSLLSVSLGLEAYFFI